MKLLSPCVKEGELARGMTGHMEPEDVATLQKD